jgi:hypothetical protein
MKELPVKQVSKSHGRPLQLPIQPNAKVMQADFGGQTSLKSSESMRTFSRQAKGVEQFLKNRLNALTQAGQPARRG